jgi:hypothetical protein
MRLCSVGSAVGLGLLLCRIYTSDAQPVSFSMPLVVSLAEVDRYKVYVHPPEKKPFADSELSLIFKDLNQTKVDELVINGLVMHRPVWVIAGKKVLLKARLVGEAICPGDQKGEEQYGLLLGFDSAEDAENAAALLKAGSHSQAGIWRGEIDDTQTTQGSAVPGAVQIAVTEWSKVKITRSGEVFVNKRKVSLAEFATECQRLKKAGGGALVFTGEGGEHVLSSDECMALGILVGAGVPMKIALKESELD